MNEKTVKQLNGVGSTFRFITPALIMVMLFLAGQIFASIREIRSDIKDIKKDIVYKCDYVEDIKDVRSFLKENQKRIRYLEIKKVGKSVNNK